MRSLPMQRACLELRVASVAEIGPGQQNLNPGAGHDRTHGDTRTTRRHTRRRTPAQTNQYFNHFFTKGPWSPLLLLHRSPFPNGVVPTVCLGLGVI